MKTVLIVVAALCGCIAVVAFGAWFFSPLWQETVPVPKASSAAADVPRVEPPRPGPTETGTPRSNPTANDTQPGQPPKPARQLTVQEKVDAAVEQLLASKIAYRKLPMRLKVMVMADEFGLRVVMALTEKPQVSSYAVEALGWARHPELTPQVLEVLKKKWRERNIEIVCHAVTGYARVKGNDAVPEMARYIAANYRRPDGFGEHVCGAAAAGLAEIGTRDALDGLIGQLARVDEPIWLMDYGSRVIAAIVRHDAVSASASSAAPAATPPTGTFDAVMGQKTGTPPPPPPLPSDSSDSPPQGLVGPHRDIAREALIRYAEGLRRRLPRALGTREKSYIQGKINEALVVAGLEPEPLPETSPPSPPPSPPPPSPSSPEGKVTRKDEQKEPGKNPWEPQRRDRREDRREGRPR